MKPNLTIGLMLCNHHPELEDEAALRLILEGMEAASYEAPGEVAIAVYTPEDSVWVVTIGEGVWELTRGFDGSWQADEVLQ